MSKMKILLTSLSLLLALACGGGSSFSPLPVASSVQYQDPVVTSSDWALLRDAAASTSTHLVLRLVGPQGELFRGAGFNLKVDTTKVKFARFKDAPGNTLGYLLDNGVFHDVDEALNQVPCLLTVSGVKGDTLSAGIFQKCLRFPVVQGYYSAPSGSQNVNDAVDCSSIPTMKIALDLNTSQQLHPGSVTLAITKAGVIPNEVSNVGKPVRVAIKVGTLTLQ